MGMCVWMQVPEEVWDVGSTVADVTGGVSHWTWALETKLGFSGTVIRALNH